MTDEETNIFLDPAVVAWFVRVSGNNTGHLRAVVHIPLGEMKISNCPGLCYDSHRGIREMDYENP